MAERVKDYQLNELADQNETSKRIEDAKSKKAHKLLQNNQQVAVAVVVVMMAVVVFLEKL